MLRPYPPCSKTRQASSDGWLSLCDDVLNPSPQCVGALPVPSLPTMFANTASNIDSVQCGECMDVIGKTLQPHFWKFGCILWGGEEKRGCWGMKLQQTTWIGVHRYVPIPVLHFWSPEKQRRCTRSVVSACLFFRAERTPGDGRTSG